MHGLVDQIEEAPRWCLEGDDNNDKNLMNLQWGSEGDGFGDCEGTNVIAFYSNRIIIIIIILRI